MKAIGTLKCAVCRAQLRGYAPRGWTPGGALCTWLHKGLDMGRCPGSYQPGLESVLDGPQGERPRDTRFDDARCGPTDPVKRW